MFAVVTMLGPFLVVGFAVGLLVAFRYGELMRHDQTPWHRCGFPALYDEAALRQEFAEAVGLAERAIRSEPALPMG